jgi:hypothetical protein
MSFAADFLNPLQASFEIVSPFLHGHFIIFSLRVMEHGIIRHHMISIFTAQSINKNKSVEIQCLIVNNCTLYSGDTEFDTHRGRGLLQEVLR